MIEPTKIKFSDLRQALQELEAQFVNELEDMLISQLMEKKSVQLYGQKDEVLEFAGKTNYKIRLRRPQKNVWSVSFKDFRESIRKVLRNGTSRLVSEGTPLAKRNKLDLPTSLLLNVLPAQEYENRSFIGNKVTHPMWGEGNIVSISDSGNVEVQFTERIVTLKPNFIKLETA